MAGKMSDTRRHLLQDKTLEYLYEHPQATYTDLANYIGTGRNCVGEWYRNDVDGYKAKYDKTLNEAFQHLEGKAIDAMSKLIDEGNFNAAKYVLDNRGYKAEDKLKAEVNGDMDITINIGE